MPDRKPPRLAGDGRATLLGLLQYQRDSFVRKVIGVEAKDAEISPVPSGTSLLWLTNHVADAEITWVLQRFAQKRDDELFEAPATDLNGAVARYQRTWRKVDSVVAETVSLDALCPSFNDHPRVNLRWILAHLLEETARHAGHADILRENIDGQTGR